MRIRVNDTNPMNSARADTPPTIGIRLDLVLAFELVPRTWKYWNKRHHTISCHLQFSC